MSKADKQGSFDYSVIGYLTSTKNELSFGFKNVRQMLRDLLRLSNTVFKYYSEKKPRFYVRHLCFWCFAYLFFFSFLLIYILSFYWWYQSENIKKHNFVSLFLYSPKVMIKLCHTVRRGADRPNFCDIKISWFKQDRWKIM